MKTGATEQPWYIGERAEQIALLWLTEVDTPDGPDRDIYREAGSDRTVTVETNVEVKRGDVYIESDFRITLTERDRTAHFFVDVKGTTDTSQWITADGFFNSGRYVRNLSSLRLLDGPVAVIVVNVKSRETYFGWLIPPAGCASVLSSSGVRMRAGTEALVHQVFNEVLSGFRPALDERLSNSRHRKPDPR